MFTAAHLHAYRPRGIALAAGTFIAGITIGTMLSLELVGRQVMANTVPAALAIAASHRAFGSHPAEVSRVLDGDTFEARVHLWPGLEITTKIRLRGIDAPELKARCAQERIKAETAREALVAILGAALRSGMWLSTNMVAGSWPMPLRARRLILAPRCSPRGWCALMAADAGHGATELEFPITVPAATACDAAASNETGDSRAIRR